ncbi:hypothetical protein TRIUR3_27948 [Triticum urartu]|uniref:Uncharacterized protein n=1 Tax=Triticum urartu TaxID=4572 RepID=M7ZNN3_TRIUA|nr:hypothetical protein TRIUR3_27948 [Triticum urartu]
MEAHVGPTGQLGMVAALGLGARSGPGRGRPCAAAVNGDERAAHSFSARQGQIGSAEGQRRGGIGTWRGDCELGSPGSEAAGSISAGSGQNEEWQRRRGVEEDRQRGGPCARNGAGTKSGRGSVARGRGGTGEILIEMGELGLARELRFVPIWTSSEAVGLRRGARASGRQEASGGVDRGHGLGQEKPWLARSMDSGAVEAVGWAVAEIEEVGRESGWEWIRKAL